MEVGTSRRKTRQQGAAEVRERSPVPERFYDAFVVRLWHDRTTGRLLRAEVEHAASGECTRAAGPAEAWVLDQIRACLAARLGDDASPPPARPE